MKAQPDHAKPNKALRHYAAELWSSKKASLFLHHQFHQSFHIGRIHTAFLHGIDNFRNGAFRNRHFGHGRYLFNQLAQFSFILHRRRFDRTSELLDRAFRNRLACLLINGIQGLFGYFAHAIASSAVLFNQCMRRTSER